MGITRALAARDDVELVLVVAAGEPPLESLARFEQHPATGSPFTPTGALGLSAALRRIKPDLTHCLHFPTPLPAAHPLVVTLHDLTPLVLPEVMPSAMKRAVYRTFNARATSVADAVLVPSRYTADDVERLFPRALGKVRITPEAADDFSAGEVGAIPTGLLAEGGRYVLSMGNTKPNKDLPTLFSAFAKLAASDSDVVLLLAGAGDDAYLDASVDAACRARVRFTGRVDDAELRALYAGAAAFAFPSRYEGFGLPPLEAMSFGAPVVVARAASLPEVAGDAALLFEPGDASALASALERVLGDAATRERLVAAGRERAAEFSWARTAEQTVAVYREVFGR